MRFALYNVGNGKVVSTHHSLDGLALPVGCAAIEVDSSVGLSDALWVVDGVLMHSAPPSENHTFNYKALAWELDLPTFENRAIEGRHKLLLASDWATLPDVNLTDAQKAEWATYRQALRDITDQPGYPLEVVWPTPPA